jgi:RalA-binding protein 1
VGIVFAPTLNIPAPLISMFLTDYADIFGASADEAHSPIQEIVAVPQRDQSPEIRSPRHQMFSDIPSPTYNQTAFNPAPSHFPMPGGVVRAEMASPYDTGFIPMRPSYESTTTPNENSFASMNSTMRVPPHPKDIKAKRRESSMLYMNTPMNSMAAAMNKPRQGSLPHLGNQHVVREETGLYD